MTNVTYSLEKIVADLDASIRIMKHDTLARKTSMVIEGLCRDTEEGINAIIGIAYALGWTWGGFHWYHV